MRVCFLITFAYFSTGFSVTIIGTHLATDGDWVDVTLKDNLFKEGSKTIPTYNDIQLVDADKTQYYDYKYGIKTAIPIHAVNPLNWSRLLRNGSGENLVTASVKLPTKPSLMEEISQYEVWATYTYPMSNERDEPTLLGKVWIRKNPTNLAELSRSWGFVQSVQGYNARLDELKQSKAWWLNYGADYRVDRVLGQGAQSIIVKIVPKEGKAGLKPFVLKLSSVGRQHEYELALEHDIIAETTSPYVIKLWPEAYLKEFAHPINKKLISFSGLLGIALEFIDGQELFEFLKDFDQSAKPLPLKLASTIFEQISQGLNALDCDPYDFHSGNVMISIIDGQIKATLIDFGRVNKGKTFSQRTKESIARVFEQIKAKLTPEDASKFNYEDFKRW